MFVKSLFLAAAALGAANAATAAVLIEAMPTIVTSNASSLQTNGVSFTSYFVQFTLSSAVDVTGFSIVTPRLATALGAAATFRLRADDAGKPAGTNLTRFNDTIDSIVNYGSTGYRLAGVSFDPIRLEAGTYWASLAAPGAGGVAMQWVAFNNGNPVGPLDQYSVRNDLATGSVPAIYDLGWQLHGTVVPSAVPEPATWAMLIAGFGLTGAVMRRRAVAVRFA